MVELTVAVASACIAATIAAFQFILPNALALVLTGFLDDEQPAVTWSVVSRFFLSSDWPLFLQSETTGGDGVPGKVSFVTWTKPITLVLIAVAAVVTPLGLYDEVSPATRPEAVKFAYIADPGLFGSGTPLRSSRGVNFSRMCDDMPCPGDPDLGNGTSIKRINSTTNLTQTYNYYLLPKSIPANLIDMYQIGPETSSPSMSGYFDIQTRQWSTWQPGTIEKNESILESGFSYLSSVWMNDKIELVEGLIVDSKNGGIGFRNHSAPSGHLPYGAEWEEDILWMQPETSCVDTNITALFTGVLTEKYNPAVLVDRGGFSNIQRVDPYYKPENVTRDYIFAYAQKNPSLYERAYYLAWYNNAMSMLYLDITDKGTNRSRVSSVVGQEFLANGTFTEVSGPMGSFFRLGRGKDMIDMPSARNWNSTARKYNYNPNPLIRNSQNITNDWVATVRPYCRGIWAGAGVDIDMLDINIGTIAGPASAIKKPNPDNPGDSSIWQRPFHVCASATKVTVKTVRFRYNNTQRGTLADLEITNITDKAYTREEDKPTWGFETPFRNATTTWNVSTFNPLWGRVNPKTSFDRNTSLLRSERFYLPASQESVLKVGWSSSKFRRDFTPGTTESATAWNLIYQPLTYASNWEDPYMNGDPKQLRFFRDMTKNATSTATLMNILWTDLVANSMVGTRGIHTPRYKPMRTNKLARRDDGIDLENLPEGHYPVYFLKRSIRYKWIYGIPALISAGVIATVLIMAFIAVVCGYGTISRLRWFMFHTSPGRLLAYAEYPEHGGGDKSISTKHWLHRVGWRKVRVSSHDVGSDAASIRSTEKGSRIYTKVRQIDETDSVYSIDEEKRKAAARLLSPKM